MSLILCTSSLEPEMPLVCVDDSQPNFYHELGLGGQFGFTRSAMKKLSTWLCIIFTSALAAQAQLPQWHAGCTIKVLRQAESSNGQAPTDAQCRAAVGIPCYSPQEIRTAYGLNPILDAGYTGTGETIVIIDSFGSPTIAADLKAFDQAYGLPDPPSFMVLSPLGTVPFDPTNGDMVGWAFETSLDVEWSHAIAPGANIVLLTSPVDETEGVQGMPEFLELEKYALDHHLGHIISQSWGATENTLFTPEGLKVFSSFENFYQRAADEHVTVFASAGDTGSANYEIDGVTLYPFPVVGYPASSPHVTAVGGTSLYADTNGNYQYETVWNESAVSGGAGGGGISQFFAEPVFQQLTLPSSVQKTLNRHRGMPDVAYNGDPYTSILVYVTFFPSAADNGFYFIGGTSEGSPQWAGIIADTNQLAGHPMGFLNDKLYVLGATGQLYHFFRDITVGNNSYAGVPGYSATRGWDLASGWGTPNLGKLIPQLAKLPD
jgi:subtilase family serine protease